jgi:glucose/arabinose dehydrogenase
MNPDSSAALTELGRIRLAFINALHQSYGLAVRPNDGNAHGFDLFFNIGAAGNDEVGPEVKASGLVDALLAPASIYMTTLDASGPDLSATNPVQVASGLRNAAALLVHPATGDLWIGENGIDGFESPIVSFSADELDVIPAEQIGDGIVDFGFPISYIDYATGENVNDDPSFVDFRPLLGSESEGIAGIALIPDAFPDEIRGGLLAGFHGQFDRTGIYNEENPVRFVNLTNGDQIEIVTNDALNIGHLDSFATGTDAIYMADFCTHSLTSSQACGVIYRLVPTEA